DGGSFYLNVTVTDSSGRPVFPHGRMTGRTAAVTLHWGPDGRKLAELSEVGVPDGLNVWDRAPVPHDQRFVLVPSLRRLVVLPAENDRLLVYKFDPDEVLARSGADYLLVDCPPPPEPAVRGRAFTHFVNVRSKKGGAAVKLDAGPPGLTVSPKGRIDWAVPADFA